jgi:hypothetical protein
MSVDADMPHIAFWLLEAEWACQQFTTHMAGLITAGAHHIFLLFYIQHILVT